MTRVLVSAGSLLFIAMIEGQGWWTHARICVSSMHICLMRRYRFIRSCDLSADSTNDFATSTNHQKASSPGYITLHITSHLINSIRFLHVPRSSSHSTSHWTLFYHLSYSSCDRLHVSSASKSPPPPHKVCLLNKVWSQDTIVYLLSADTDQVPCPSSWRYWKVHSD